jgi:hypothetical protein
LITVAADVEYLPQTLTLNGSIAGQKDVDCLLSADRGDVRVHVRPRRVNPTPPTLI